MTEFPNGASRVYFIAGDPIAQVKAPEGVTQALQALGHNAWVMPAHVRPADLAGWLAGVSLMRNVDGIIITVPHKFAAFALCATASERARFLQTANMMRRNPQGGWHGDMCDGLGYVEALRDKGFDLQGKRVLLAGAGGAGSAIAHAFVMADAAALAIHDEDVARRTTLVERLAALGRCPVSHGSSDPGGFDLVINATPAGMKVGDPEPVQFAKLTPAMFVGCVVTEPAVPPIIAAARAKGCGTVTGIEMFEKVRDLLVKFLLEKDLSSN